MPTTGLYTIAFKAKQNLPGHPQQSQVLIDGKVPFAELDAVEFGYSTRYRMHVLGDQDEPYLFYLSEGRHEITLEVVLGEQAALVQAVEASLYELNRIYRRVIMVISPDPDLCGTISCPSAFRKCWKIWQSRRHSSMSLRISWKGAPRSGAAICSLCAIWHCSSRAWPKTQSQFSCA